MIVVVLTLCPQKLRGHLTRWLLEISPGVYVGSVTTRVRELLWDQILENIAHGRAIMAYQTNSEQGFGLKTHGQDWQPIDVEGITLMLRPNTDHKQVQNAKRVGWSKASRYRRR